MKKLLRLIAQIFGIKSFKPVQTIDYTLIAGKVSKNDVKNLEKK